MKVIIPETVKDSIKTIGNKTIQRNALKIYAALYKRSQRANKHGYFQVPSTYLEKINSRYYRTINKFIEDGIIQPYKREKQLNLFDNEYITYYNPNMGISISYKFLVDINDGEEIEVDLKTNREYRWYSIIKNSLIKLQYDVKITRDTFGRRVYHSAINEYKGLLSNRGLMIIDCVASQPTLLYLEMKKRNIIDSNYFDCFDNKKDFYNYIGKELNLDTRQQAKDLFMEWLNGWGYVKNYNIHLLFPIASNFIKNFKHRNYKDMSSHLQRVEAKIWIDNLLENLPSEFALPVHDCLIVDYKEADSILEYCKNKYPELEYKLKEL